MAKSIRVRARPPARPVVLNGGPHHGTVLSGHELPGVGVAVPLDGGTRYALYSRRRAGGNHYYYEETVAAGDMAPVPAPERDA